MKKARICGILLFLIFSLAFVASAEIPYETYTYSFQGEIQSSPHAFYPQESISLANTDAGPMKNPSDIVCFGDMVLVADTGNNRVLVLDKGLKLVKELSVFIDSDGKTGSFNQPQGVFGSLICMYCLKVFLPAIHWASGIQANRRKAGLSSCWCGGGCRRTPLHCFTEREYGRNGYG